MKISYSPKSGNCYHRNGEIYEGDTFKTVTGKTCSKWKDFKDDKILADLGIQFSDDEILDSYLLENYCRNLFGTRDAPFCIVNENNGVILWEYCDIPKCIGLN